MLTHHTHTHTHTLSLSLSLSLSLTAADAEPDVGPALMANTLVYAVAEKYDIHDFQFLLLPCNI